jgi:hypothetical protein
MSQSNLKRVIASLMATLFVVVTTPREQNAKAGVVYVDKSIERAKEMRPSLRGQRVFLGNTQLECKPQPRMQKIECR